MVLVSDPLGCNIVFGDLGEGSTGHPLLPPGGLYLES